MIDLYKRFEVAYNFQDDYIEKFTQLLDYINIVFVQAFAGHAQNARPGFEIVRKVPNDWESYAKKVNELKKAGFDVAILFQEDKKYEKEIIDLYCKDLRIDAVITVSDELATYIKKKYPHIKTIASIVKCLTFEDYFKKDLTMYDEAVLDFPFERGISAIKMLPSNLKYNIIVNNNTCIYNCPKRKAHWKFGYDFIDQNTRCNVPKLINSKEYEKAKEALEKCMLFYPKDLEYFDDCINNFKIQGREYSTNIILEQLLFFITSNDERRHSLSYFNDAITDGTIKL